MPHTGKGSRSRLADNASDESMSSRGPTLAHEVRLHRALRTPVEDIGMSEMTSSPASLLDLRATTRLETSRDEVPHEGACLRNLGGHM